MKIHIRHRLLATTLLGTAFIGAPAMAQDASNTPGAQATDPGAVVQDESVNDVPVTSTNEESETEEIVVTGTLFRSTTSATVSPITVVTSETLEQRGINTVQEGIQQLASNNGPALTNSFTSNGAFAAGASAVSLRGLSTNSTLVLFDGQRAAYYPLADDGSRNFVDLNTIPDDVVDRIEVLRDGASSTYGADAIAGVVNVITKRQITGVSGRAEAGISEDGNAANQRVSLTAGIGSLSDQGFNAYLSGFFYNQDAVYNRALPYPFNTDDQSRISFDGNNGPNNILNARDPETGQLAAFNPGYDVYARAYNATNTALIPGARNELLNPGAGCRYGPGYQLTPAELALRGPNNADGSPGALTLASAPAVSPVCTLDITNAYGVASPNIQRFGGTGRFTARIGDDSEAFLMVNFQQSTSDYTGTPPQIRAAAPAGILFPRFSTSQLPSPSLAAGSFQLSLPVYVCANGVGDAQAVNTGCNATNGVLNPNNPFAAQGQVARILGRPISQPTYNETRSRVYRAAAGISGTIFEDVDYRVDATAMHNDLRRTQNGYVYIANLLTSIAQGTFNFVNPDQNSQQTLDFVSPDNFNDASSDLYAAQASLSTSLFDLPGGPLQIGGGVSIRYEAIDAPSANPDTNGPTQRFFTLNAFGTSGDRTVYSAFGEIKAPVFEQLTVEASGRYDDYSSGQSNFSPKIGVKFAPIRQVSVRGTYSRGFRIPSFGEANALPTTGFVANSVSNFTDSFLAQYGCSIATYNACPNYIRTGTYGQTTIASPDLDPEKSRSFLLGAIVTPIRAVTFTVDYFDNKKTGAITQPSNEPGLLAYYSGQPAPEGYTLIPGAPDINNPNATPILGFVQSQLVNANTIRVRGLDFAANARFQFGDISFSSSAEASYILELSTTFPDGTKERYEGTLGNFNLTSGNGTPRWHGSWQNTADFGKFSLTGTAQYFGGYDLSAEDQGTEQGDCGLNPIPNYVPCKIKPYITLDMVGRVEVNENFTFYVNVLNVLNDYPDVDPVTYGAHLYNAVQGGTGIFGRQFRAGARFQF